MSKPADDLARLVDQLRKSSAGGSDLIRKIADRLHQRLDALAADIGRLEAAPSQSDGARHAAALAVLGLPMPATTLKNGHIRR